MLLGEREATVSLGFGSVRAASEQLGGEGPRRRALAGASRTDEQVGMDGVGHGRLELRDRALLPDHVVPTAHDGSFVRMTSRTSCDTSSIEPDASMMTQ